MNSNIHIRLLAVLGSTILLTCQTVLADAGTAAPAGSALSINTNFIPANSNPQKGPTLTPPTNPTLAPPISPTLNTSNHPNLAPPVNPNFTSPTRGNLSLDPNAPGPGTKPDDIYPPNRTNGIGGTNGFFRNPGNRDSADTNGFFRPTQTNGIPVGTAVRPVPR